MTRTTILAECGRCFFQGRAFHPDPACTEHTIRCEACGQREAVELIDCKPSDGDWECGDYDRHECIACYGPGYTMNSWGDAALSVRPELAGLYEAHVENRRLAGIVWC